MAKDLRDKPTADLTEMFPEVAPASNHKIADNGFVTSGRIYFVGCLVIIIVSRFLCHH